MTPIRSFIAVLMVFVLVLCFSFMAAAAHTRSTQDSFAMSLAESPPSISADQNTYNELSNSITAMPTIEHSVPLVAKMQRAGETSVQAESSDSSRLDASRSFTKNGAGHTEKTRLSFRSYRTLRYT